MWSIVDSSGMGNSNPLWGPSLAQKRNLHFNFANLAIAPGKSFNNPNFVNKSNPSIHNYQNNYSLKRLCQIDNSKEDHLKDSSVVNSSKNIDEGLDIIQNQIHNLEPATQNPSDMCYSKKLKKNHRNRRRKRQNKNFKRNKKQREMHEMMDEDVEIDNSLNNPVGTSNSNIPNTLCLEDFIVELSNDSQNYVESNCNNCLGTEFTVGSATPPNICLLSCTPRRRQNSVTESEDSFIVFDSGTDDELDFSEESEDESEMEENDSVSDQESESEIEEDLDSSSSVIPSKRVRFADDCELCEVHPMVQWAYAYKQARKGPWEVYARDRCRFKKRVDETETILIPILDCKHREKVFRERFQNLDIC